MTGLDVGVAIAAFDVARALGASEAVAYLVGGIGPVAGAVAVWLRARTLSGASLAILAFTVLSALAALIGGRDPRVLLYKDAVVTALIGLIFACSLLFARPLSFYFGQRFATDGTPSGVAAFDAMWRYPLFRRAHHVITAVWAATYVLEATAKTIVIRRADFSTAYTTSQVMPLVATGLAIALTVAVARHYQRVADRQPADDGE